MYASNKEFGKGVTVAKLKELLNQLLDDDILYPNAVGNLAVYRNGEHTGFFEYTGFLDIGPEKIHLDSEIQE